MEWEDFQCSDQLDDSWYEHIWSPEFEPEKTAKWSFEENKLFENALAEAEPESLDFFENIAAKVPWKSIDEIKIHYQALVQDVEMIESGQFPTPDYMNNHKADDDDDQQQHKCKNKDEGSPANEPKNTSNSQPRRRGVPWTEEEHQLFLMGLNKYGKGDWRSISRYYVISKTPTQVASHAQKYFRRQMSTTPMDRRRPSIHDIQSVNPIVNPASVNFSNTIDKPVLPNFSVNSPNPNLILNPDYMINNNDQNPFIPSVNLATNFDDHHPINIDHVSSSYPSSYLK